MSTYNYLLLLKVCLRGCCFSYYCNYCELNISLLKNGHATSNIFVLSLRLEMYFSQQRYLNVKTTLNDTSLIKFALYKTLNQITVPYNANNSLIY